MLKTIRYQMTIVAAITFIIASLALIPPTESKQLTPLPVDPSLKNVSIIGDRALQNASDAGDNGATENDEKNAIHILSADMSIVPNSSNYELDKSAPPRRAYIEGEIQVREQKDLKNDSVIVAEVSSISVIPGVAPNPVNKTKPSLLPFSGNSSSKIGTELGLTVTALIVTICSSFMLI